VGCRHSFLCTVTVPEPKSMGVGVLSGGAVMAIIGLLVSIAIGDE
jgi:hypothetical protein